MDLAKLNKEASSSSMVFGKKIRLNILIELFSKNNSDWPTGKISGFNTCINFVIK